MIRRLLLVAALLHSQVARADFTFTQGSGQTAFSITSTTGGGTALCAAASTHCWASVPIDTAGAFLGGIGNATYVRFPSAQAVTGTFWQATQPVSGTFWQATQPVSGPLTDTQLRATAVPVSGPLTDTELRATAVIVGGTVTASGPLTDTQLRATPVPVIGVGLVDNVLFNAGTQTFSGVMGLAETTPTALTSSHVGLFSLNPLNRNARVETPDVRPSSGTITIQDTGSATTTGQNGATIITGTPTASSFQSQAINGQANARILVTGTWTGTLEVNGSLDGTTWTPIPARVVGSVNTGSTLTANGQLTADISGLSNVRVRATAAMTGTATVTFTFTAAPGTVQVLNPIRLVDNTSSAQATIKPASTAPLATDTAFVVTLGQNAGLFSVATPGVVNHAAAATGGCTPAKTLSAATTNATSIKGSAGTLCKFVAINTTATLYFLKTYNTASAPTCNSDTVLATYPIPPSNSGVAVPLGSFGEAYTTGIGFCLTGAIADNDNTAAATGVALSYSFK